MPPKKEKQKAPPQPRKYAFETEADFRDVEEAMRVTRDFPSFESLLDSFVSGPPTGEQAKTKNADVPFHKTCQQLLVRHGYKSNLLKKEARHTWTREEQVEILYTHYHPDEADIHYRFKEGPRLDYQPVGATNGQPKVRRTRAAPTGPLHRFFPRSTPASIASSSRALAAATSSGTSTSSTSSGTVSTLRAVPAPPSSTAGSTSAAAGTAAPAPAPAPMNRFSFFDSPMPADPNNQGPSPTHQSQALLQRNEAARFAHAREVMPVLAAAFKSVMPGRDQALTSLAGELLLKAAREGVERSAADLADLFAFRYASHPRAPISTTEAAALIAKPWSHIGGAVASAYGNVAGRISNTTPTSYLEVIQLLDKAPALRAIEELRSVKTPPAQALVAKLEELVRLGRLTHIGKTVKGLLDRAHHGGKASTGGDLRAVLGIGRGVGMKQVPSVLEAIKALQGGGRVSDTGDEEIVSDGEEDSKADDEQEDQNSRLSLQPVVEALLKSRPRAFLERISRPNAPQVIVMSGDGAVVSVRVPTTVLDDDLDPKTVSATEFFEEYLFAPTLNFQAAGDNLVFSPLESVREVAVSVGTAPQQVVVVALAPPTRTYGEVGQEQVWTGIHAAAQRKGFSESSDKALAAETLNVIDRPTEGSAQPALTRAAVEGDKVKKKDVEKFEKKVKGRIDGLDGGALVLVSTTTWFNVRYGLPTDQLNNTSTALVSPFRLVLIKGRPAIAISTQQPMSAIKKGPAYGKIVGPVISSIHALALIAAKLSQAASFDTMTLPEQATFVAGLNARFGRMLESLTVLGTSARIGTRGGSGIKAMSLPTPFIPAPQAATSGPGAAVHLAFAVESGNGMGTVQLNNLFTVTNPETRKAEVAIYGDRMWIRVTARRDGHIWRVQYHPSSVFKYNPAALSNDEIQMLKEWFAEQAANGTYLLPKISRCKNKPSRVILLRGMLGANENQHPELVNLHRFPLEAHGGGQVPLQAPPLDAPLPAIVVYVKDRVRRLEEEAKTASARPPPQADDSRPTNVRRT